MRNHALAVMCPVASVALLVALLVTTIEEPARPNTVDGRKQAKLLDVFRFISREPRTFLLHFTGYSLLGLVFNAFIAWAPTFFIRAYGLTAGEVGLMLGTLILVFGGAGMIAGGMHTDRLRQLGEKSAPFISSRFAGICLTPICIAIGFSNSLDVCHRIIKGNLIQKIKQNI